MNLLKKLKILIILGGAIVFIIAGLLWVYLCGIPSLVESESFQNFADAKLNEYMGVHMVVDNLYLKTGFPDIEFKVDLFKLVQNDKELLVLDKTDTKFSISQLMRKRIIVKRLGADYIFADINKILSLIPQQEQKEEVKSDWYADFLQAHLYVKQLKLLYSVNGISFDVDTKNLDLDIAQPDKKYIHFDFKALMNQGKNRVCVLFKDNNKIYIWKKKLFIDESVITLNKSKLHIKGNLVDDKKFKVDVFANRFDISNIVALIESDLVIKNGSEMLAYFNDIKGNFDFNFSLTQKGINGKVDLHKLYFILVPIENVPVHMHSGNILVDTKNIYLKNFAGYYGTRPVNTLKFEGEVKDYTKTFETHIKADGIVADDFAKYYLTPVIGIPINIVGKSDTKLFIDFVNNVINLKWLFRVLPEDNLLVCGEPISPYKEERVIISNMEIKDTFLKIKDLNYIVTVPGVADFYRRKLISLHGLIDFSKGVDFRIMGFEIEKPVPSGFLNIIARQELFKNGTAVGKLMAVDGPKGVKLFGDLTLDKILVPSQRLYIEKAHLKPNFNTIDVTAEGGYRKSKYAVTANINNQLAFPMVVNNIDFSLDSMDIKKLLESFNQQGDGQAATKAPDADEDLPTFDITNLIIKNCKLKLGKAVYDDLSAENMEATLTLDEKGELDLDSNRFDFAQGHSSAHVCCDLKNHKYHVKLGVKDVDSNLLATSLLNLPKEISGKASGILDLNTDDSFKLNGKMKFLVKQGTIGKIGLIEYVLNVASVFRNPIAMINPMIIFDLINVPNGEFDKIEGSLDIKDNLVDNIKIKSFAQYLGAYIVGNYNIEKKDASLRIYTKMTNKKKGVYGFLRNISLANVASRVSLGARNDVNYYSSDISEIPKIDADEKDCQLFVTTVDGDVENYNFLSSLKKLK